MSSNDTLPTNKLGNSFMTIADLQWTNNDLSFVVLFALGYFCIISKLGHVIYLLSPKNIIERFYSFHKLCTPKVALSLKYNSFIAYGNTKANVIRLKNLPDESLFTKIINPLGRTNTLLHLFGFKPELALKEEFLLLFSRYLEKEVLLYTPRRSVQEISSNQNNSAIDFVNPFPSQLKVDVDQVLRNTMKLLQAIKYQTIFIPHILEIVLDQFINSIKNLFSSIFLFNFLVNECLYAYFLLIQFDKCFTRENGQEILLEKQKALFLIYCLMQFRNKKATSFNVFYLIIADIIRKRYKYLKEPLEKFVDVLKLNIPLRKTKNQNFFSFEFKMNLEDKSTIYKKAHTFCTLTYTDGNDKPLYFKDTILSFFDSTEMTYLYNRVLQYLTLNLSEDTVFDSHNEYLLCLYKSALLTLRKNFTGALKVLSSLNIDKVKDDEVKLQLSIVIIASCMLVIALSIVEHAVIDIKELINFLCRVLVDPKSAIELFERIKMPMEDKVAQEDVFMAVGLSMQISLSHIMIPKLLKSERSAEDIWLGFIILNAKVSTSEDIELLKKVTFDLCKRYSSLADNVLTTIASLLSPCTCSFFSSIVINELVEYGIDLIDNMDNEAFTNNKFKTHILSVFIESFKNEISADSFKKLLNHQVLHKLLEETIMILAICESKGLNIGGLTEEVLKLLWNIVVITSIKDNIKSHPIKLVSSLLRFSNKPRYVQRAKDVLSKSSLINTDTELIKELAHVLADNGDKIIQEEVLQLIKAVS